MTLPARDLTRLRKLAGLLTSDADGERATAARMATDLLRANKTTWAEVLGTPKVEIQTRVVHVKEPCPHCEARRQQADTVGAPHWRQTVFRLQHLDAQEDVLSDWERGFLRSLLRFRRLSEKQEACLDRIAERVLE